MKEGWTYKKLGEVARVQNGFAFDSKFFNEKGDGTPLIRIRDIKRAYSETFTTESCSDDYIIEDGNILIGMDGDFNVCSWAGGHAYLNQRVCRVISSEKLLPRFIYYLLPFPLKRINEKTSFSTVKHLSSKQVNNIIIPVPPLPEQRAIVARLDSAFAQIDSLKANAEKQLSEARQLFQKALEEAMTPKEGWEEKTLGEITTRITDGSHNPPRGLDLSEYEMLSSKNVRNDHFTFDNPRYLSKEDFEKEDKRTNLEKGDVLLTIVGAGLGDCCVYEYDKKIVFQRSVSVIKPSIDIISSRFLMYTLQHNYNSIRNKSNGAAQKGIYLKQLAAYETYLPPLSTQHTIVARLDSISSHVRALEEKLKKMKDECDALKQAMLREIFE